ncbi:hypothetical protein GCL60_01500 [Silvanigrella paludirubra]|uniref:Uncharacterized protein n=1 Tax=Silvanigrella paludirubra TaxID=2499159 RepID=A0A6N6VVX6_9BACT|nr:hypothetical protein [Silvanigrella paludirubra]KAB8040623.1 hypothetical protein GCL60_01500 [Silvanigrella paludirubra]
MNTIKIFQKYLFLCLFIILSNNFISCHHYSGQSINFQVNAPSLNNHNRSSSYTSFITRQIPIQITNSSGFNLQTTLNSGSNSVQLPTGSIHIKIGYLADGLKSSQTTCDNSGSNNSSGDDNKVLYTEFESDFTINSSTSSININFPNPFTEFSFDHFGFIIIDASGNPAVNAQVYYVDPISNQKIYNPCKGIPENGTTDSLGRFAVDLPVYNNSKQFYFNVVLSDGTTQNFKPTLARGASKAQFYFMKMASGSLTAMNDQTDSFLGDGFTIAQRRDTLLKNPRFPDITSATLNSPDYDTGFASLYPNYTQTENQYDLIYRRKLVIMCQILDSNNNPISPFSNYQICNNYYPDIGLITSPNLSSGSSYNLNVYYYDTEGYCPLSSTSGCTASIPLSKNFMYK